MLKRIDITPSPQHLFFDQVAEQIELRDLQERSLFILADASGRVLLQERVNESHQQIDLSQLPGGLYIAVLQGQQLENIKIWLP